MIVANNNMAALAMAEVNKNSNNLKKEIQKATSGIKINSARDDASGYAISEKMKVRIRGLDQDVQNVQNGRALLKVADGGMQVIIDELRCLRELAINSANDHNSDADRLILQREFDQRKATIDAIAEETNYNGIPLLNGMWCQKSWAEGMTDPNIISQNSSTTVLSSGTTFNTVGPTTTTTTLPTTKKTTTSSSTVTSATPPVSTDTVVVGPTTLAPVIESTTSTTGPSIISSTGNTVSTSTSSKSGNLTTVIDTDTTTNVTISATTTSTVETTTVQKVTVTTMTSVEEVSTTVDEEPILITNGTTSITSNGVYRFASDYTGTLNISANSVEIMGPTDGATLTNVHIVDNGVDDLYLKNVSINNTENTSVIAFDSNTNNTLHLLGSNSISDSGCTSAATIYCGGGLSIVGNGSLSVESAAHKSGAILGSDTGGSANGNCGDIAIGQSVTLNINMRAVSAGAGIGSGAVGATCGDISIGSNATVTVTVGNEIVPSYAPNQGSAAVAIGSGNSYNPSAVSVCGNITIYANAHVTTQAQGGAGIGNSDAISKCGDILIYSDASVHASSKEGAGIGTGNSGYPDSPTFQKSECGNITVYSYSEGNVIATTEGTGSGAEAIGHGNTLPAYAALNIVGTVNLSNERNAQTGGIADYSELSLGQTTTTAYQITTTTITSTDTIVTKRETTTTDYETSTETTETVTTTIYEDGEYELREVLNRPLIIHTGTRANQHLRIYIEDMRQKALGIDDILINTRDSAAEAISEIDDALEIALDNATQIGAYYSRLESTEDTLVVASENTQSSDSTICDADMAMVATAYTKDQLLTQSAQAMLAQANQNLSRVLELIGSSHS